MYPFSHFSVLFSLKGKLSDMKSSWSQGPISQSQASLSHELWKVPQGPRSTTAPSRPPPGLTNSKPSSAWSGNSLGLAPGWNGSYSSGECSDPYNETYMRETPDKSSPTLVISEKLTLKVLIGEASSKRKPHCCESLRGRQHPHRRD